MLQTLLLLQFQVMDKPTLTPKMNICTNTNACLLHLRGDIPGLQKQCFKFWGLNLSLSCWTLHSTYQFPGHIFTLSAESMSVLGMEVRSWYYYGIELWVIGQGTQGYLGPALSWPHKGCMCIEKWRKKGNILLTGTVASNPSSALYQAELYHKEV